MTEDRNRDPEDPFASGGPSGATPVAARTTPNPLSPRRPIPPAPSGTSSPLRNALLVVGVFTIVFGLFIVLRHPATVTAPTYDESTRVAFLAACSADGGASSRPVCGCAYDAIAAKIPYDRFRDLDTAALARRGLAGPTTTVTPPASTGAGTARATTSTSASPLPDDVQSIFATCVAKQIIATSDTTAKPAVTAPAATAPATSATTTIATTTPPKPS